MTQSQLAKDRKAALDRASARRREPKLQGVQLTLPIEGTPQCIHCDKLAVFSYKQVPICERCLSTVNAYADVKLRELEAL
jgi:hypothetical protein